MILNNSNSFEFNNLTFIYIFHSPWPEGWWPEYPAAQPSAPSRPYPSRAAGSAPCSRCSSWSSWSPRGWWSSPSRSPAASPPRCPGRPCQTGQSGSVTRQRIHRNHGAVRAEFLALISGNEIVDWILGFNYSTCHLESCRHAALHLFLKFFPQVTLEKEIMHSLRPQHVKQSSQKLQGYYSDAVFSVFSLHLKSGSILSCLELITFKNLAFALHLRREEYNVLFKQSFETDHSIALGSMSRSLLESDQWDTSSEAHVNRQTFLTMTRSIS